MLSKSPMARPGVTRALLLVQFAPGRVDLGSRLSRSRALALAGELGLEDVVENSLVHGRIEDRVRKLDLSDRLPAQVVDLNLGH